MNERIDNIRSEPGSLTKNLNFPAAGFNLQIGLELALGLLTVFIFALAASRLRKAKKKHLKSTQKKNQCRSCILWIAHQQNIPSQLAQRAAN